MNEEVPKINPQAKKVFLEVAKKLMAEKEQQELEKKEAENKELEANTEKETLKIAKTNKKKNKK